MTSILSAFTFAAIRMSSFSAVATLAVLLHVGAAQAQSVTFVSHTGDDSKACTTPEAPCLTISGAYGKTSQYGTVNIMDSG